MAVDSLQMESIDFQLRAFFEEIRKYKHPRLSILISQEKLPLNAVCLLRKYVDRRFFYRNIMPILYS